MEFINFISLILFCVFGISYILKLFVLSRKDKIKANVLGKSNKQRSIQMVELLVKLSSFLWLVVWLLEVLFSDQIKNQASNYFTNYTVNIIGLFITAAGVFIFILAMGFMKSSWRVGIDKQNKSCLVTNGIYRFSRNPAFVGFDLMFLGLFLTFSNYITLFILVFNLLAFHLLIKQEEKHLMEVFAHDYVQYSKKVPRYFLFL